MLIKSFITGKRGEGFDSIEDSMALDTNAGRYAISDGVTYSFLPKIWSNILVQAWLTIDDIEQFSHMNLSESFLQERNRIMDVLDEDTRMDYEDWEDVYQTASATFCGVQIRNGILKWGVLGDTCLFLLLPDEHPRCISSRPMPTDESGHITPSFDNRPNQILADGRIYGEWVRGEMPFEKGTILLMSDAMSAWFINAHNDDKDPLSQLLALSDNDAFEQWVDEQVNLGLLGDDDESVIIIQIDDMHFPYHTETFGNAESVLGDASSKVAMTNACGNTISKTNISNIDKSNATNSIEEDYYCIRKKRLTIATKLALIKRRFRIKYKHKNDK